MKYLIIITLLTKYAIAVDNLQSLITARVRNRQLVGSKSSKVSLGKGSKSKSRSQSTTSTKSLKATSDELSAALNSYALGELREIQIPLRSVEIGNAANATNATNATTAGEDLGIHFLSKEVDVTEEDLNLSSKRAQKNEVFWKRNLAVSTAGVVALLAGVAAITTMKRGRRRAEVDAGDNDVLDSDEISPSKDADDTTDYFSDLFGLTNW